VILGVSNDPVEDQKRFATEQGFPYRLLADVDKRVSRLYDAERQPGEKYFEAGIPRRITYLVDPKGKVRKTWNAEGADLAAHASEVLAAIQSAPKGL
jgi:peroxiredoxin Q/BCP